MRDRPRHQPPMLLRHTSRRRRSQLLPGRPEQLFPPGMQPGVNRQWAAVQPAGIDALQWSVRQPAFRFRDWRRPGQRTFAARSGAASLPAWQGGNALHRVREFKFRPDTRLGDWASERLPHDEPAVSEPPGWRFQPQAGSTLDRPEIDAEPVPWLHPAAGGGTAATERWELASVQLADSRVH